LPQVLAGKNVLVAAHGNSLRALIMRLDKLSTEEILQLNLPTGEPYVYRLNSDGSVASKATLTA
jgi:2,3-bisphosphoglycerate-dependent phosphoglycerate mutase